MKRYLFLLCTSVFLSFIAGAQCNADFSFQQDPCSPKTVSFSSVLSSVQSFLWDFGNSTTNNSSLNPSVVYTSFGNYTVSLTVTFTGGCTVTSTHVITVVAAQDNDLISTPDNTICAGESIALQSNGTAPNFCWHTAAAALSSTDHNITVAPTSSTVYYYTEQQQGGETVMNGDFSNGNTSFTTDYSNCNSFQCIGEGNYAIGPDAQFYHFDFRGFDHTTGTGNFLMANGMLVPNANVWCQSVNVTPNTAYDFSMWLCTVAGEYAPAELQLLINGVPVGTVATAPSTIYTWTQHTATWNSGPSLTADLCIVTVSDWFGGNDFGIDDISFGTPATSLLMDSVIITVQNPPTANISYASPLCTSLTSSQSVSLTGSGSFTGGSFSAGSGLSINPVTGAILPSASTPGTYTVTYITGASAACAAVSAITTVTITAPVSSITSISICNNQLPYSWNGSSYTAPGTYTSTFISSSGCDSIATLNLTVNNTLSSTTNLAICPNQLPYTWNGNSYTAAGMYMVTLVSSAGCDSLATLNLTVNNVLNSTTTINICTNQLPYTWNGNNYTSAGTYSFTLISTSGCDSVATLNLTVNNTLSSTTNLSICANQLPYTWNGNSYTAAGTYMVTLVSSSGCDSVATLNLTVNTTLSSTTNINICTNQLPYTWNGNNYTTAGTYSFTLMSSSGCDSVATLNLTVNNTLSSTTTLAICPNQLPYTWNGNSYTAAGMYMVTLLSSSGCDSVATLNLTVNNSLSSTTNLSICPNQLPYTWNGNIYAGAGMYTVTLVSSSGCDSVATLNLTVNNTLSSTTNLAICPSALPFLWNGFLYTGAGTYVIHLINSTGCDSLATLILSLRPVPVPPTVVTPVYYCQYENASALSATSTGGGQLLWYNSAAGGTGVLTAPIPATTSPGTTIWYVSQNDGFCESPRIAITVTINSNTHRADTSLTICSGSVVNMYTSYHTSAASSTWTFNEQPLPDVSHVNMPGIYVVILTNNVGCLDTALVHLMVHPPVIAQAGNDTLVEAAVPMHLSGSGGTHYQWWPAEYLDNPFISNPVASLLQDESFVLMASDGLGCFGLDTVSIRVLEGPAIYVPTAFSPNADGLNDVFKPITVGITSLEYFRVFNRWGQMVFETTIIGQAWDGMFRGFKQPIGNYVWQVKGTDRKGSVKVRKGNVMLIR